jgi:hypothetical protein
MSQDIQTRWVVAPSEKKAFEFAIKRGKDLPTTYQAGQTMLAKVRQRGPWDWRLYVVRFIVEIEEEKEG